MHGDTTRVALVMFAAGVSTLSSSVLSFTGISPVQSGQSSDCICPNRLVGQAPEGEMITMCRYESVIF